MQKIKYFFIHFINWLIRLGGIIEGVLLIFIGVRLNLNNKDAKFLILAFVGGYLIYRAIVRLWKVHKSKLIIRGNAYNNRTTFFEGPNGRGKTSLMLYSASVLKTKVLSNVPFKVNGDFVYKLDNQAINLQRAIPEGACVVMDEISLFYHNLDKVNCYDLELLLQLQRHFFDGNFYMASIKASRLPQQLREKTAICNYLLGQRTEYTSFVIGPILYFIFNKILRCKKINIGFRVWTYQTFEDIDHENYNFDLSNESSQTDTQTRHFSNLVDIYAFNDVNTFEYNDRFMKYLYDMLPKTDLVKYESLDFDEKTLFNSGYGKIITYMINKLNNIKR